MITKDDVFELYQTIKILETKQERALDLAKVLLKEIDDMGEMIKILKNDYNNLKKKTK